MKKKIFVCFVGLLLFACNNTLQCERHFVSKGFIGKVKIYFDQINGQKNIDKDGCIVYNISEKGECFSSFPFKEGNRFINNTFKCFEVFNKDTIKEIPVFTEYDYLKDTVNNKQKKYVFFTASGYENPTGSNPNYVLEYYIDYGRNYRNY